MNSLLESSSLKISFSNWLVMMILLATLASFGKVEVQTLLRLPGVGPRVADDPAFLQEGGQRVTVAGVGDVDTWQ